MIVKLLTKHHLELLSLKGGCRGSSQSSHVKMSNCWKSHAAAHLINSMKQERSCKTLYVYHCVYVFICFKEGHFVDWQY